MKRLLLILVATVGLAGRLSARLGENEHQCTARYGKPKPSVPPTPGSDKTLVYGKDGVVITAEFLKGRCSRIIYEKAFSYVHLTDAEVSAFFKANGEFAGDRYDRPPTTKRSRPISVWSVRSVGVAVPRRGGSF